MITEFDKFNKLQDDTEKQKNLILELIDEFVEFDDEFRKDHRLRPYFKCNSFHFDEKFYVWHEYDRSMRGAVTKLVFTDDDYKKLLKFMENPELYKSTKKYNL